MAINGMAINGMAINGMAADGLLVPKEIEVGGPVLIMRLLEWAVDAEQAILMLLSSPQNAYPELFLRIRTVSSLE